MNHADYVVARRRIEQSPLTDAPAVPKGANGYLDDVDEPYVIVDFGEPYGHVLCEPEDIR